MTGDEHVRFWGTELEAYLVDYLCLDPTHLKFDYRQREAATQDEWRQIIKDGGLTK